MKKGLIRFSLLVLALVGGAVVTEGGTQKTDSNGVFSKVLQGRKAGEKFTVWVDGFSGDAIDDVWIEVESREWGLVADSHLSTKYTSRAIYTAMTAEEWDGYDAESGGELVFTVHVSGAENASFNLNSENGTAKYDSVKDEEEPDPWQGGGSGQPTAEQGSSESVALAFTPKQAGGVGDLANRGKIEKNFVYRIGYRYYLSTTLTEGSKYFFGYAGGNVTSVTLYLKGTKDNVLATAKDVTDVWTDCTRAFEVVAPKSGTYYVLLEGSSSDKFAFYHAALKTRGIADHESNPLVIGVEPERFAPGYLSDPAFGYDEIIDDRLFRLSGLEKDASYIFRTEGADKPLLMRLYDSKGGIIAENRYAAAGANDVRIGWTAPSNLKATDAYYLGVCQQLAEGERPSAGSVALKTEKVVLQDEAEPLKVKPVASGASFEGLDPATLGLSPRSLGPTSWVNTYTLAGRAGVTYRAKVLNAGEANGLRLTAHVYQMMNGKTMTELVRKENGGAIDVSDSGMGLQIRSVGNGTIYVEVSVSDDKANWGNGQGLDYGPYELAAVAEGGALTVDMIGAPKASMQWKLWKKDGVDMKETVFYPVGSSAILSAGSYMLQAQKITGFKADKLDFGPVTVVNGESAGATYKYEDDKDPGDDTATKPTELKLSEKGVAHSLLSGDTNDWYVVKSTKAGAYYRFAFTEKTGNPVVRVFGPDKTTECPYVIADDPATGVQICATGTGPYYVVVSHADGKDDVESSYTIQATSAVPGEIKFAKTEVAVKDNAGYVDLSVSRTGKDGKVRCTYRTEGVQSNKDDAYYFPTSGELTWEAGDQKAKTIRVKLVPNTGWTTNRIVRVVLGKIPYTDESFDRSGEYEASFAVDSKAGRLLDTATITVQASAKKVPGTVQAANAPDGNVKKPVYVVKAGEAVRVKLDRAAGADGTVGVTVETAKGTANKSGETDFLPVATNLVWGDGETRTDEIVIRTMPAAGDFTGVKNFTLKLTAIKAKTVVDGREITDAPTLAASSITINITNEKFDQTMADWAKTLPKAGGVAVKGSNWFRGNDASLYATIARKITGPARVRWGADGESLVNVAYVAKSENVTMPCTDAWVVDPLPAAVADAPTFDKAAFAAGSVEFKFNRDEPDVSNVSYRVYALSDGASRTNVTYDARTKKDKATVVKIKLGDPETEIVADKDGKYVTNVVYEAKGNKGKYTWRVDTFFEGGSVTNVGKVWTLNVLKDEETGSALEVGGKAGVYEATLNLGVTTEILLAASNANVKSFAVVSGTGKLPDGLKMELDAGTAKAPGTKNWYLRYYPTKAGDYACAIQATYSGTPTKKSPAYALKFHVTDLPKPVALAPTVDKAVVVPCVLPEERVQLAFSQVQGATYEVYFKDPANKATLGKPETLVTNSEWKVCVAPGAKCTWKVVATYPGQDAKAKKVESATFNLTGAATNSAGTAYLTKVDGMDAYRTPFAGGATMRLRQRLAASFRIVNDLGDTNVIITSVKAVSGKLPDGIKFEQDLKNAKNPSGDDQWYIRGTPTKAGAFQAVVQATFAEVSAWHANGTPKTKKEYGATTLAMDFAVEAEDTVPDLTFTLTGPGRFTYAGVDYIGRETNAAVDIAAGSKSLVLKDIPQLDSYFYEPILAAVATGATVDKALVAPGEVAFSFNRAELDAKGISYRVYALSDGASRTNVTYDARTKKDKTTVVKIKLGDPETEIVADKDDKYATNVVYEAKGNKGKYTWRVDTFFAGRGVTNVAKSVWTLTVLDDSKGGNFPATGVVGVDGWGREIDAAGSTNIVLHQLVKAELLVGGRGSTIKTVSGKLPDGLKFETVKPTKNAADNYNRIFGTPTKVGSFAVLLQETDAKKVAGTTTALTFEVEPVGTAQGEFGGLVTTFDTFGDGLRSLASVTFSAPSTGKLSAKVKIAGKDYAFEDSGYACLNGDPADSNVTAMAELVNVQKNVKIDGKSVTYTNFLYVTVFDLDETNPASWLKQGDMQVMMTYLVDATGKAYDDNIWYEGWICRDNSKLNTNKANDAYVAKLAEFSGYYTVSLANPEAQPGDPKGNGYLTMTLDAKGKAKFAGKLADGTSYSASNQSVFLVEDDDGETVALKAPLFACKSPYVFGGWLVLGLREDAMAGLVPVVNGNAFGAELVWRNDDPNSTRSGLNGFSLYLHPVGGWYDTIRNLQRQYLEYDFNVDLPDSRDDFDELRALLAPGYAFVAEAMPQGQAVNLLGDALSADKQAPAPKAGVTNDWPSIVNPANVTVKFDRKSGILNGTFDLWYRGEGAKGVADDNKLFKGLKYESVLLLSRDNDGYFDEETWASGFFTVPQSIEATQEMVNARTGAVMTKTVTRKWNGSYRFDIRATKVLRVWKDAE